MPASVLTASHSISHPILSEERCFIFFLINFSGSIIAHSVLLVGKIEGKRRRG